MTDKAVMTETLSHWGRAYMEIEAGEVKSVRYPIDDKDPSRIHENYIGVMQSPMRIRQPMVRKGWLEGDKGAKRGEDQFVAVSWDEIADILARELRDVIGRYGNSAIFGGSYGWASAGRFHHAQSQIHRFFNVIGGYTRSVNTHSHAALEVALPHVTGSQQGMGTHHTPWDLIIGESELFVAFGGLPERNAQISAGGVGQHTVGPALKAAKASGVKFINISPLRDDLNLDLEAEWIAPRANSDLALILALCFVLDAEGLADLAFLKKYATGYETFLTYLRGETDAVVKTPEWAAALTGLAADDIRALARRMAGHRTMISCAWALQRAAAGEQIVWGVVTLAAMLGQIGLPGGGFGFGYAAANRVGNRELPFDWPAFPQLKNPQRSFIPVARLGDMLENPGQAFEYNGGHYHYPEIQMIWWAGGNPFHHQQDLNRLRRVWKRPATVVVQEPFWNAVAKHGDIILPCTLPLERDDIGITKAEPHLIAMKKQIDAPGEALDDYEILKRVAAKMGVFEAFTEGKSAAEWQEELYADCQSRAAAHGYKLPDFKNFWAAGGYRFDLETAPEPLLGAYRQDPEANPLATPSGKIEIFSAHVASFGYAEAPGFAFWRAPEEWLGTAPMGALHLISNQPAHRLHSQLDLGPYSQGSKRGGREVARIHPEEAALRGLQAGEIVQISSARGRLLASLMPDANVAKGHLQMATGAWLDIGPDGLERHGNVNVLTRDVATSRLAQGSTAHSALVFIDKVTGDLPKVEAFRPPEIVQKEV